MENFHELAEMCLVWLSILFLQLQEQYHKFEDFYIKVTAALHYSVSVPKHFQIPLFMSIYKYLYLR